MTSKFDSTKPQSLATALELQSSVPSWLRRVTHRLSIRSKIAWGYVLAFGIAVLGTTAGFAIGDFYNRQALDKEEDAVEEMRLLTRLQITFFQLRTHQQQFVFLLEKPEQLHSEYSHFFKLSAEFRQLWIEFKSSEGNTKNLKVEELPGEIEGVQRFLQIYNDVPEAYLQQTEELIEQLNLSNLKSEEIEAARKRLLNFGNSPTVLKFENFSDHLIDLLKFADEEYEEAEAAFVTAQALRLQIIAGSMLLSVALAAILALYTSQAIAQPIQLVTKVALQATESANFHLQAPVMTQDEVGVLATSFNSLIRKVAEYTQELELGHQTLEIRVEKRTQELRQALDNLQKTQAQLIQTEKMSSLGQLVAGVAHEINNPVSFIYGNINHASEYTQDLLDLINLYQQRYPNTDPEIQERIETIDLDFLSEDLPKTLSSMKIGAERIREIVLTLRNFSRLDEADMKPVNIHEGIDSTLLILQNRLKAKPEHTAIEIIKKYSDLPLVECYAGQLNQVFMNILSNAIDALDNYNQDRTKEEIKNDTSMIIIRTKVLNGDRIAISIQDNGSGMTQSVKQRLFDPFFTTKPIGKGTGLGLSISYQIVVDKHGGKMECISEPGQGAEFWIEIPIKQI